MPSIVDKKRVGIKNDRRVKLTGADRDYILAMKGVQSIHSLANEFGVSRRTIQFILYPERLEANKAARIERGGWKQYYDKDNHRKSASEHREYKNKLVSEGKI